MKRCQKVFEFLQGGSKISCDSKGGWEFSQKKSTSPAPGSTHCEHLVFFFLRKKLFWTPGLPPLTVLRYPAGFFFFFRRAHPPHHTHYTPYSPPFTNRYHTSRGIISMYNHGGPMITPKLCILSHHQYSFREIRPDNVKRDF